MLHDMTSHGGLRLQPRDSRYEPLVGQLKVRPSEEQPWFHEGDTVLVRGTEAEPVLLRVTKVVPPKKYGSPMWTLDFEQATQS